MTHSFTNLNKILVFNNTISFMWCYCYYFDCGKNQMNCYRLLDIIVSSNPTKNNPPKNLLHLLCLYITSWQTESQQPVNQFYIHFIMYKRSWYILFFFLTLYIQLTVTDISCCEFCVVVVAGCLCCKIILLKVGHCQGQEFIYFAFRMLL